MNNYNEYIVVISDILCTLAKLYANRSNFYKSRAKAFNDIYKSLNELSEIAKEKAITAQK